MGDWASLNAARFLWQEFRADARRLPRLAWRRWLAILVSGAGLLALLSLAAVWIVRPLAEAGPLQAWDAAGVLWVAEHTPLPFAQSMWFSAMGDLIVLLPVVVTTVVIAVRRHAPFTAATMLAGYGLVTGLLWVGWSAWSRARPDLIIEGMAAPGFHAFPSGHMMVSIPVYGFLCYLWCAHTRSRAEQVVAVLLATLFLGAIAWARLVLGAHWPTDILAGVGLGLVWLGVKIVALRRAVACAEGAPAQGPAARLATESLPTGPDKPPR